MGYLDDSIAKFNPDDVNGFFVDKRDAVLGMFTQEMFGESMGGYVDDAIKSGLEGFASGGILGGILGVFSSIIDSSIDQFGKPGEKDQPFQDFVRKTYNDILSERSEMTKTGLQLANMSEEQRANMDFVDQFALAKGQEYKEINDKTLEKEEAFQNSEIGSEIQMLYGEQGKKEATIEAEKQAATEKALTAMMTNDTNYLEAKKNNDYDTMLAMVEAQKARVEMDYEANSPLLQEQRDRDVKLVEMLNYFAYNYEGAWNKPSDSLDEAFSVTYSDMHDKYVTNLASPVSDEVPMGPSPGILPDTTIKDVKYSADSISKAATGIQQTVKNYMEKGTPKTYHITYQLKVPETVTVSQFAQQHAENMVRNKGTFAPVIEPR